MGIASTYPDSRYKSIYAGANFRFNTSIIASSVNGEGNWLTTGVAPGAAPNTGRYFDPVLYIALAVNPAMFATGGAGPTITLTGMARYVIEARGSKL